MVQVGLDMDTRSPSGSFLQFLWNGCRFGFMSDEMYLAPERFAFFRNASLCYMTMDYMTHSLV